MCWGLQQVLQGCGRPCWLMELGEQLTWLLPLLILICLCCRYILSGFCKLSLKLFLTLLTEAESKGLLGGFDSLVSFPGKYVPSFLEWTLTTSPLLPSAVLQLPGAGWAQHWGPVQRCPVSLITRPESRSQGPRVVPSSRTSAPAWGRAGWQPGIKTGVCSLQWTVIVACEPQEATRRPSCGRSVWSSCGHPAPRAAGPHGAWAERVFLATLSVAAVCC